MKRLSITQAWNEAAPFLRRHGGTLFVITFAFSILPTLLLQIMAPPTVAGQQPQAGPWLLLLIPVLIGSVIASLAVSSLAMGRETIVRGALAHAIRRFLPVFGAVLLVVVLLVLAMLLFSLLLALSGAVPPGPPNAARWGLPALLILLFFIFFWTRFMLLTPVGAGEPIGPVALVRRAWRLTSGNFWRLFGFLLIFAIAFTVVSLAIVSVFGLIIILLAGRPEPGSLAAFFTLLLNGALSAGFTTVLTTMLARFYVQLAEGNATSGT